MGTSCWSRAKREIKQITKTRAGRGLYSGAMGVNAASSVVVYISAFFSTCFNPAVTFCCACSACIATSAFKYNQLSPENDRLTQLERKCEDLETVVRMLAEENAELREAADRQYLVSLKILSQLPQPVKEEGEEILDPPPQQKMNEEYKKTRPIAFLDSVAVGSRKERESKINPHHTFSVESQPSSAHSFTPLTDITPGMDEDEDANKILEADLEEISFRKF